MIDAARAEAWLQSDPWDVEGIFDFFKNQDGKIDQVGKIKLISFYGSQENLTGTTQLPVAIPSELQGESDIDFQSFKQIHNKVVTDTMTLSIAQAAKIYFDLLVKSGTMNVEMLKEAEKILPKSVELDELTKLASEGTQFDEIKFNIYAKPILRRMFLAGLLLDSIKHKAAKRIFRQLASFYTVDDEGRLPVQEHANWKKELLDALGACGTELGLNKADLLGIASKLKTETEPIDEATFSSIVAPLEIKSVTRKALHESITNSPALSSA